MFLLRVRRHLFPPEEGGGGASDNMGGFMYVTTRPTYVATRPTWVLGGFFVTVGSPW